MFFSGCFSDDACGTPARYLSHLTEITSGTPPYTAPGVSCRDILKAMTHRGDGAQPAAAGSQSGEQSGSQSGPRSGPQPGAQPKATIYDVARVAGVSPSTVSRAFTQPGRVSYKTAEKVRIAARQVGYGDELETGVDARPESRGLGARHTGVIGMVAPDVSNPFFVEIFRGAEHAAAAQGMVVTLLNANESTSRARTAIERITPHVDGLLLVSSRMDSSEIQKIARTVPTVVVSRPISGIPSVMVDNYDGAVKALVHLVDQGCRSITYVSGPHRSWSDSTRWRGIVDAATALGTLTGDHGGSAPLPVSRTVTIQPSRMRHLVRPTVRQLPADEPSLVGGRRAFGEWAKEPTDAVICFNDMVAVGFIQQAESTGIRVPADVAVVGFDNTEISVLVSPSLTTVAAPLRSVGRVGTANLIAIIKGMKAPLMAKPRELPTRLIVRESSLRVAP